MDVKHALSYHADCYHEDKKYENGEETMNPDPCKRCFCKGNRTPTTISCILKLI